jgi:hypothetical protein
MPYLHSCFLVGAASLHVSQKFFPNLTPQEELKGLNVLGGIAEERTDTHSPRPHLTLPQLRGPGLLHLVGFSR